MFRLEFENLWAEADKCVTDDIAYRKETGGHKDLYCFDYVPVICQSGVALSVSGSYSCRTGAITFTFTVDGLGPVTRYCLGGPEHRDATRYHQHLLRDGKDPRRNLPYAEARPSMEEMGAKQAWEQICKDADIAHTGMFFEPEVNCS